MKYTPLWTLAIVAVCLSSVLSGEPSSVGRIHEAAQARPMPEGAPRASDVIMRSLTLRKGKGEDRHDTFEALRSFHVSRLEWAYIRDKEFIARCQEAGILFGGAASSAMSHVIMPKGDSDYAALACVNLRGQPVVPTWKRTWRPPGNWWMCVNNPTLEERYVEYLKSYLDAGAQVMQRDEPWGNYRAVDWGGCFCDHCMEAFREYLADSTTAQQRAAMGIENVETFNYREMLIARGAPVGDDFRRFDGGELKDRFRDFQLKATVAFHKRTRRAVDEHAGRRVSFSCNNGCNRWTDIELGFDWCFGELSFRHADPGFIHSAMLQAAALGKRQVVTMPKKSNRDDLDGWCRLTRQTIAMAYACGGHCMVPWDVYMPSDAPRYFGTAEQYADLFGFIRASSTWLDGYEYAGAFGAGLSCGLYGERSPVTLHGGKRLCAVLRALPGKANAPVVLHLVDWSDSPLPFQLSLEPDLFFGGRPLKVRLLRPVPFEKALHERAEQSHSYGQLVETIPIKAEYTTTFSLPAVSPWAMLVIEPDTSLATGMWQPTIEVDELDFYRDTLTVRLATATPGASLHFTTDGSQPSKASPRYREPIQLGDSATVRCMAVLPDGRSSAIASASLTKVSDVPRLTAPDLPALAPNLKLWLAADSIDLASGTGVRQWPARVGPSAMAEPHKSFTGVLTGPPTFNSDGVNGQPVVRFDGVDDSLAVKGFANNNLAGKDFTIFMVTRAENNSFGMCGNGIWGTGGEPRLYMQRSGFHYDQLNSAVGLHPTSPGPTISTFMHDGRETMSAASDGVPGTPRTGVPVVSQFGSGGNLTIPFWSGNENCPGDMAEVVVYDRLLSPGERAGVEAYLAQKYGTKYVRRWRR